jgi:FMN phosphatase YigB (HAD superfamily)
MGLADRLDQTYLSHRIGFLKPAKEAFVVALEGMGLPPREVLFVDDSARNVEAAAALGMHAHVARGPADAREVLVRYAIVPSTPSAGAPLPRASRR